MWVSATDCLQLLEFLIVIKQLFCFVPLLCNCLYIPSVAACRASLEEQRTSEM